MLLPHLLNYDPADSGVAEALAACDPSARERRDGFVADLVGLVHQQSPEADVAVYADWYEPGLILEITVGTDAYTWSVEALFERAGGDAEEAVRRLGYGDGRSPGSGE